MLTISLSDCPFPRVFSCAMPKKASKERAEELERKAGRGGGAVTGQVSARFGRFPFGSPFQTGQGSEPPKQTPYF